MKRWLLLITCFCCLWFSSTVYATEVTSGGESATPTVDAILNGEEETGNSEEKIENPNSTTPETSTATSEATTETTESEIYNPMEYIDQQFPAQSLTEVGSRITQKGGEILKIVQIVGYIIVTIVFVIAVILIAINKGTGSNHSNNISFGVLIVCVVCYVLIFIGPGLLEWFRSWSVS